MDYSIDTPLMCKYYRSENDTLKKGIQQAIDELGKEHWLITHLSHLLNIPKKGITETGGTLTVDEKVDKITNLIVDKYNSGYPSESGRAMIASIVEVLSGDGKK